MNSRMSRTVRLVLVALAAGAANAAEPTTEGAGTGAQTVNPWANYRFASDALTETDLASTTAWALNIDGGPPRPIKVTAGGWNSDQQDPQIPSAAVKQHAVYEREIAIPPETADQAVKILFGGCNYAAEVFLDDKPVAQHSAVMTPFVADLTRVAQSGKTHVLRVKAYPPGRGLAGGNPHPFDFNKGTGRKYDGSTKFAYGLIGHVRLAVYPVIHVADVHVRPSVASQSLAYDVWIANGGARDAEVVLKGSLSAWDRREWAYPVLPERKAAVPAGRTVKVTVENVSWKPGPKSYWWPNIPFKEDYAATLHWLNLAIEREGRVEHRRQQRFGFVEYGEGPYSYTVNGVRFNGFGDSNSYGQVGEYDCWTETPCFQPPHGVYKGCAETWKRYQRIGFNTMRLSTSCPTRYMLETADEAGFLLVPEGGSWQKEWWHKEIHCFQLQETIRACRNHPCVARYSLCNESFTRKYPDDPRRWLIDAAIEVDPTRPYVYETHGGEAGPLLAAGVQKILGMKGGHAAIMAHYQPIAKGGDFIRGMGECSWSRDIITGHPRATMKFRFCDYAYFAPWSWINSWPNFLEGMNAERHPWQRDCYGDRKDGVDGWGSPVIQAVQRAFHPYLILDHGLLAKLKCPGIDEKAVGRNVCVAGAKTQRPVEVFNDSLTDGEFTLHWTVHGDSVDGPVVSKGTLGPFALRAGFHATQTVAFEVTADERLGRSLFVVLTSNKDGKEVYRDEGTQFVVEGK